MMTCPEYWQQTTLCWANTHLKHGICIISESSIHTKKWVLAKG